MCGILGTTLPVQNVKNTIKGTLKNRGPDAINFYETDHFNLAESRLTIQPSKKPYTIHQRSPYSIAYNGEVYNASSLRAKLRRSGYSFSTKNDGEVVLKSCIEWGSKAPKKFNGMFSFIFYNRNKKEIIAARDRFGVKPLFYYKSKQDMAFASRVQTILTLPGVNFAINKNRLNDYLQYRFVPGAATLTKNIKKIPPAHVMQYNLEQKTLTKNQYWTPSQTKNNNISKDDAIRKFDHLLKKAVKRRIPDNRPYGVYASGGVDSSMIMSYTQNTNRYTYTLLLSDTSRENKIANKKSMHQNLNYNVENMKNMPAVAGYFSDPIGDETIYPMDYLAQQAQKNVRVVLSGEGADELLGGYPFITPLHVLRGIKKYLPNFILNNSACVMRHIPTTIYSTLLNYDKQFGRQEVNHLTDLLNNSDKPDYANLLTPFTNSQIKNMLVAKNECTIYNNNILDFLREDWLPNNVLAHLDTVTMRHSLESRVPYLDHELVEFIYSLPVRHLYDLVSDKKILRKTGKKRGCKAYSRPKDTFSLPGANYRKTDYFRNLVDQYLSEQKLDDIPGLNGKKTSAMVRTNQKKDGLLADKRIITILNLSMWYSRIKDKLNNEQK